MTTAPTSTILGMVLDRSSSMAPYTGDTVTGYNQFVDDQRAQPGECRLSLMLFSHGQDVAHVATPIADVPTLTQERYRPNGNTALLDSFGMMIDGMARWVAEHGFAGQVKIVVFTDGEENASREYTRERLNEMVGQRQAQGWEFIFLGSGGAAWLEGRAMSNVAASSYDVGVGGQAVYDSFVVASSGLSATRSTGVAMAGAFDSAYGNEPPKLAPEPSAKDILAATAEKRRRGFAAANAQPKSVSDQLAGN